MKYVLKHDHEKNMLQDRMMTWVTVSQKIKIDYKLQNLVRLPFRNKSRQLFRQHTNLLDLHLDPSLFRLILSQRGLAILL